MSHNSARLGVGVKYPDSEYIGFIGRLIIIISDMLVVILALLAGYYFDYNLYDISETYNDVYGVYVSLFFSYMYLTFIKASKWRTIGHILTKSKVVTLKGVKPNQMQMTYRLLFWIGGPINFIFDIVFLTMVKEKRTMRDCLCNTLVVKVDAKPIKLDVPIHLTRVYAFGLNLMYESCYSESS